MKNILPIALLRFVQKLGRAIYFRSDTSCRLCHFSCLIMAKSP
nr:MAG TPA: hypothetical protein [Caudoviricetes sp.]